MTDTSVLARRSVKSFDMPRRIWPDGSPRFDSFGFFRTSVEDVKLFRVAEEVLFENR